MMKKKRVSVIVLSVLISIGIYWLAISPVRPITAIDYSYFLEKKEQEITVSYVRWACACANWIVWDEKYTDEGPQSCDDCLFLESTRGSHEELLRVIDNNQGSKIKLTGLFYKRKGISRDYEAPTPEHPSYARVFRYRDYEIVY